MEMRASRGRWPSTIKQHLKIKSFLGTTANAVMTQRCVSSLREVSAAAPRALRDFQAAVTALTGSALWETKNGTGTKVETAQLVRKTAKAFVCRRIG